MIMIVLTLVIGPVSGAAGGGSLGEYERALNAVPTPESLRAWHDLFGSEPHVAGTPGDHRNLDRLAAAFESLGLHVQRHEVQVFLAEPIDATLQITSPVSMTLPLMEAVLTEDPASGHPDLTIGWNAYSGSGDVSGEVVYANYGTREDFDALRDLGVDVEGRIVIARYGRNFRGYKAKFAEAAGAAGLVIYTDPDDSGYRKGIPWPKGGYANDSSIQRGSLMTLAWPGDPLTPFEPATADARRLDATAIDLPRIPVQPIGWGAAHEILSRMNGPAVPDGWQGGLPFAYRVTGGETLRVRLMVEQKRALARTANIIGVLPGAVTPQQKVIVGCHHDAWGFGAADPLAGTIALFECAKSFAELARQGTRPDRTIVFAAWGAEEFGIIGSVEWCEANRDDLLANAVAYINLDMASMGPKFASSSAPALKRLIASVTRSVPQARDPDRSVADVWVNGETPTFGNLGGGSDHIGFYCHLGIPSCSVGGHGSPGVSYHSNYDHLGWYRTIVGDDYEPALMVTRVTNLITARLAAAPLLPIDPVQYAPDVRTHLDALQTRAAELEVAIDLAPLRAAIDAYEIRARTIQERLQEAVAAERLAPAALARTNEVLLALERSWLHNPGLAQRPWFRNLFAATDPDSGYAAWMLPALRHAIEKRDPGGVADALALYINVVASLTAAMESIDAELP